MMPRSSFIESRMPSVSIIVPSFNEQGKICKMLEAVYAQTYPRLDLEVIIADGMSTDATRAEVAAFTESHPDLRICVVDNLRRFIPSGLNCALAQAEGEIIVRLDAHSMPRPDYIERSVADLEAGLGENVGGVWEIVPGASTWIGRSIAAAASHPLGVGEYAQPAFPFGFGLSYTKFEHANLRLDRTQATADARIGIDVDVTNTGAVAGEEVVQVYVEALASRVPRAPKELKTFARVALEAGETRTVHLELPAADLAYWDATAGWVVEPIEYEVAVMRHAADEAALRARFRVA